MSILLSIEKEFNHRHDFVDEDIIFLKNKFKNIEFLKIPVAWVSLIDQMLSETNNDSIKEIRQDFGQFVILFKRECNKELKKKISIYDKKIKNIDKDLYLMMEK